jgi:hypothetical protein
LFAGSTARTVSVCWPSGSVGVVKGEVQALKAPASILHSKVAVPSFDSNVNCGAEVFVEPVGPVRIVVSGAVVSTVNVKLAGVGSSLLAGSTAMTSKVCSPSVRFGVVYGLAQTS